MPLPKPPASPQSSESSEGFFAHSDLELFILEVAGQPEQFGFTTWQVRQGNQRLQIGIFDRDRDTQKLNHPNALQSVGAELLEYWHYYNDAENENKITWLRDHCQSIATLANRIQNNPKDPLYDTAAKLAEKDSSLATAALAGFDKNTGLLPLLSLAVLHPDDYTTPETSNICQSLIDIAEKDVDLCKLVLEKHYAIRDFIQYITRSDTSIKEDTLFNQIANLDKSVLQQLSSSKESGHDKDREILHDALHLEQPNGRLRS